jgi:hypothetical protein
MSHSSLRCAWSVAIATTHTSECAAAAAGGSCATAASTASRVGTHATMSKHRATASTLLCGCANRSCYRQEAALLLLVLLIPQQLLAGPPVVHVLHTACCCCCCCEWCCCRPAHVLYSPRSAWSSAAPAFNSWQTEQQRGAGSRGSNSCCICKHICS